MIRTDDELRADRVRRALGRPAAFIEEAGELYALRVTADRRRRPALNFNEAVFRHIAEDPGLRPRMEGGWSAARAWRDPAATTPDVTPALEIGSKAVRIDGAIVSRQANLRSSALAWLASRRDSEGRPWLTGVQLAAAERLQEDHRVAGDLGRLTMDWSGAPRSGSAAPSSLSPTERCVGAWRRVRAALGSLDAEVRAVIERLCFHDLSLGDVEQELGLAARAARPLLQRGLDQLAHSYGLSRLGLASENVRIGATLQVGSNAVSRDRRPLTRRGHDP